MAVTVLQSVITGFENGVNKLRAEIMVDSSSDLTTTVGAGTLTAGSIAWDVSTGDFYGLDSDGTWHKQGE